jgi:hypothetical protein
MPDNARPAFSGPSHRDIGERDDANEPFFTVQDRQLAKFDVGHVFSDCVGIVAYKGGSSDSPPIANRSS